MNQNGSKNLQNSGRIHFLRRKGLWKNKPTVFLRHPTIRHILVLAAQTTDTLGTTLRHDVQLPESHRPISGVAQIHVIHALQLGESHLIKKLKEIEPNKKSNIKHVSFYISPPPGTYKSANISTVTTSLISVPLLVDGFHRCLSFGHLNRRG